MISSILKTLREEKNITQADIASKLGISRPAYTNYERGTRNPDFDTLIKISNLFDVSTDYLLGVETKDFNKKKEPLSNSLAATILKEELCKIELDIEEEQTLETILKFINSNKEILKELTNKNNN